MHRAGESLGERVCRIVQRATARRALGPRDLLYVNGSKDLARTVATGVQYGAAAPCVGLSTAGSGSHQPSVTERTDHEPRSRISTGSTLGAISATGPWEILGRFVSTRLDTKFTPVVFEDTGDTKRMTVPGVFDTIVSAIRGRDGAGAAILSNLHNVIHGIAHVLARGTTHFRDDVFDFTTEKTHGLHSDFSWSSEPTGVS